MIFIQALLQLNQPSLHQSEQSASLMKTSISSSQYTSSSLTQSTTLPRFLQLFTTSTFKTTKSAKDKEDIFLQQEKSFCDEKLCRLSMEMLCRSSRSAPPIPKQPPPPLPPPISSIVSATEAVYTPSQEPLDPPGSFRGDIFDERQNDPGRDDDKHHNLNNSRLHFEVQPTMNRGNIEDKIFFHQIPNSSLILNKNGHYGVLLPFNNEFEEYFPSRNASCLQQVSGSLNSLVLQNKSQIKRSVSSLSISSVTTTCDACKDLSIHDIFKLKREEISRDKTSNYSSPNEIKEIVEIEPNDFSCNESCTGMNFSRNIQCGNHYENHSELIRIKLGSSTMETNSTDERSHEQKKITKKVFAGDIEYENCPILLPLKVDSTLISIDSKKQCPVGNELLIRTNYDSVNLINQECYAKFPVNNTLKSNTAFHRNERNPEKQLENSAYKVYCDTNSYLSKNNCSFSNRLPLATRSSNVDGTSDGRTSTSSSSDHQSEKTMSRKIKSGFTSRNVYSPCTELALNESWSPEEPEYDLVLCAHSSCSSSHCGQQTQDSSHDKGNYYSCVTYFDPKKQDPSTSGLLHEDQIAKTSPAQHCANQENDSVSLNVRALGSPPVVLPNKENTHKFNISRTRKFQTLGKSNASQKNDLPPLPSRSERYKFYFTIDKRKENSS